jgi:hypothetical protein
MEDLETFEKKPKFIDIKYLISKQRGRFGALFICLTFIIKFSIMVQWLGSAT